MSHAHVPWLVKKYLHEIRDKFSIDRDFYKKSFVLTTENINEVEDLIISKTSTIDITLCSVKSTNVTSHTSFSVYHKKIVCT